MASYQLLQRAGYDVVPFSLVNPDKSVRYNPLQMVIENMRRGRIPAASTELSNLSSTFFPSTGGDDFWIQTARSVFQMMTYQLMNYMIDEERRVIKLYQAYQSGNELVDQAESLGKVVRPVIHSQSALDKYIDDLWGKVSMNSMYQMIAQLDLMQVPDAIVAAGDAKYSWKGGDEEMETPEAVSGLDLMASAIRSLPDNALRRNFKGPDTMLHKASGSDATTGSIYATALNSMNFFVQETVKKLTTVSPKNGLNILDFPFPRRFSIRLSPLVMQRLHLGRRNFKATLYKDPMFSIPYGNKKHDTVDDGAVESTGWIDFWFQKIPRPKTKQFYIQIDIYDSAEENIVVQLRFAVDKGFMLSEDGRHYILDPITHEPIIKDGTAFEVKPMSKAELIKLKKAGKPLKMTQRRNATVTTAHVRNYQNEVVDEPIVSQIMFNYTEKPRALFLAVPPQIEEQSKLPLTLIDTIFNTSMGKGYEVRGDTQKPDYGTRYMLEELGNLKADGAGINALDSKLSIGLSANQQMTMVFQGMKQVSNVYGDNMYDIMKDNVGTIHYMLSTSKDTLDYISELTGKTHRVDISSQSISETVGALDGNDNSISTTKSKTEVPVITTDQLAHLTDGETVVITPTRRRDKMNRVTRTNPVFNTREQVLPFAYAVLSKQTKATEASGQGTAATASTIYSTVDARPDEMVPDFKEVLRSTLRQAMYYVRHRDELENRFMDPKTTPFGSEELSDAIMDYMTYDKDINGALIADGLAPYMMLTKDEIVNAYSKRTGEEQLERELAKQLLSQLGYDESVLGPVYADDDFTDEVDDFMPDSDGFGNEPSYMGTLELTADQFDEIMQTIVDSANHGDEAHSALIDALTDSHEWSYANGQLIFKEIEDARYVYDRNNHQVLKVEGDQSIFEASDAFRELFKGDRINDVFANSELADDFSSAFGDVFDKSNEVD